MRAISLCLLLLAASACQEVKPYNREVIDDPDAYLAQLLDSIDKNEDPEADENVMVDSGRVTNKLERLSLEFPNHVPTLLANAAYAYRYGDREKANRYLDQLFRVRKVHPEAAILRGRIALEDGNLPYAERMLSEQVMYQPDHSGLRELLASVYFLQKEWQPARDELLAAGRLGAPDWRVAFNLGLVEEQAGNIAEAMDWYAKASEARPDWQPAKSRWAGLNVVSGD